MTPPNPTGEQMGEWIQHDGKGMPVRPETSVQIKARNGYSEDGWNSAETAAFWAEDERDGGWNWKGQGGDIIAYRVVHPTSTSQQGEQQ